MVAVVVVVMQTAVERRNRSVDVRRIAHALAHSAVAETYRPRSAGCGEKICFWCWSEVGPPIAAANMMTAFSDAEGELADIARTAVVERPSVVEVIFGLPLPCACSVAYCSDH